MAAPNTEELVLISKFRGRLTDLGLKEEQNSDMELVRWIRARENNLDHAESMFRKSLNWREENDFANILTWSAPEMVKSLFPIDHPGYDKEGFPVVVLPFGRVNLKSIMVGYMSEGLRYLDQTWETAKAKMKGRQTKEGVPVTQFIAIIDMEGLSMKSIASFKVMESMKLVVQRFESNCPEVLRKCYVINSSRAVQFFFGILKPFMSGRTFGKIEIMTTEEKWKPVLLAEIQADQLPECYGGTAWSHLHTFVGYKSKLGSDAMIEYTIAAGDVFRIQVNVTKDKPTLKWEATVDCYDIDFYVTCNEQNVVPTEKLKSEKVSCGSLNCDSTGAYTFNFDNSYSRFRAKTVRYCIKTVA